MCNKDVTLVLTDDYYFYFGLKQLTGLPLVYITYEGSMDKPIVIKQKRNIRVLVDSRIFYSGKWDGYKMLRKTLNMISQWMWLDISGGGEKFYPKGCDYDIYVNMQGNLKKNIEELYYAYLKKNVSRIGNHYPQLTKKEQIILQCLLSRREGIHELKSRLKIEEKTPVSYTHLDVYKRQAIRRLCACVRRFFSRVVFPAPRKPLRIMSCLLYTSRCV